MPLDDRRLLMNGLQPARLSSSSGAYSSMRPSKRQRTEGMNSRYDRMIHTVNIMHGSPHAPIIDRRRSRGRAISSSSATSHEVPKTPSAAHSEDYRLGRDFSILKMRTSELSVAGTDMFAVDAFREPGMDLNKSKEHLPPWLQGTISSLAPKHPLRLLAPGQSMIDGESSPSALDLSSDSLPTPIEDTPFAFVAPAMPRKISPPAFNVSSTYGELEPGPLLRGSSRIPDTLLGNSYLPRPSPRAEHPAISLRPFSTPGPASAFTLERTIIPPLIQDNGDRPLSIPTSADMSLCLEEDEPRSNFVPFSTPGPLCSPSVPSPSINHNRNTSLVPRNRNVSSPGFLSSPNLISPLRPMPASREKSGPSPSYSPVAETRMGISSDASRPSSRLLQPHTLAFKPFATPGPAHILSTPVVTRQLRSLRPPPARLPPKPLYSDDFESHSRPSCIPLLSPSFEPPPRMPAPASDVPDFKWERFDRSHPQLGSSSSPVRVPAESEETFWSQPVQAILESSSPGRRRDTSPAFSPHAAPHDVLPYPAAHTPDRHIGHIAPLRNPAQLRDATPQAGAADLPRTPVSQDHVHGEQLGDRGGSQEDESGPFAWIVAPRDQPAPSTPRRPTTGPRAELGPTTPMSGPAQGSSMPSSQRGRAVSSPDAPPADGPSFAPAPGIYISPLRGQNEDTAVAIDTNLPSSDPRPSCDAVKAEILSASPAKRSIPDAAQLPVMPRRAGEEPERREDEEQACEGAEECAMYVDIEDDAARDAPQCLTSDIEEVDELEGASQVSRDSIEDWSD